MNQSMQSTESNPLPVAIIGANGYTGAEILRLLQHHAGMDARIATSRSLAGKPVAESYPGLRTTLSYSDLDLQQVAGECEVAFVCLPHKDSAETVAMLVDAGVPYIVDLSADLRYDDVPLYEKTYGIPAHPLCGSVPYGLPEWNREAIRGARLVSNPGCYVTASLLSVLPLWTAGFAIDAVTIDAKSGVSGAGRSAKTTNLLSELAHDFYAYGTAGHRHESEIRHRLATLGGDRDIPVLFSPHLLPVPRGIEASCYLRMAEMPEAAAVSRAFHKAYDNEPFIHIDGQRPSTLKSVVGTNDVAINWVVRPDLQTIVVTTTLDNLTKGAAGQAIQNANIMTGLPETTGLLLHGMLP